MAMLRRIERFLVRARISPSEFGRLAAGDPGLVTGLRRGRELRPRTEARIRAFIDRAERKLGENRCRR
jgi:hypothetical protein